MAMLVYETFGSPKPHTRRLQDIFQDGVTIPAFQQAISQSPFGLGAAGLGGPGGRMPLSTSWCQLGRNAGEWLVIYG